MTTFAALTFPAEAIGLAETAQALPDCRFKVEESAFGSESSPIHVWITASEREGERVTDALADDPSVREYALVSDRTGEWLVALTLDRSVLLPRSVIREYGGIVREAVGGDDRWTLRVRFPKRSDLSEAADAFQRYRVDVTYEAIEDAGSRCERRANDLTEDQRRVLAAALEMGYYEVPRGATLTDIAAELDVTHQSLSERLRRAEEKLATSRLSGEISPRPNSIPD